MLVAMSVGRNRAFSTIAGKKNYFIQCSNVFFMLAYNCQCASLESATTSGVQIQKPLSRLR